MANKLVLGILAGAAVGAAVSLLDRQTRQQTAQKMTNVKTDIQYFMSSRDEVKENVSNKFGAAKGFITNLLENKDYYMEKIAEVRQLTPEVKNFFANSKDAFSHEDSDEVKQLDNSVEVNEDGKSVIRL